MKIKNFMIYLTITICFTSVLSIELDQLDDTIKKSIYEKAKMNALKSGFSEDDILSPEEVVSQTLKLLQNTITPFDDNGDLKIPPNVALKPSAQKKLCGYRLSEQEKILSVFKNETLSSSLEDELFLEQNIMDIDYTDNNIPVKDQGSCGSCWAFGALGAIEHNVKLRDKVNLNLSEQQLLNCAEGYGCDGSNYYNAFSYIKKANGVMYEIDLPYKDYKDYCPNNFYSSNKKAAKLHNFKCYNLGFNIRKIYEHLKKYGPLTMTLAAYGTGFMNFGNSGIYPEDPNSPELNLIQDHAVLLLGIKEKNGIPYFIIKNSWGTNWGNNGYMSLSTLKNYLSVGSYFCAVYAGIA